MFEFAILIGVYSYIIFALGLTGLLYPEIVVGFSILFWFSIFKFFIREITREFYRFVGHITGGNLLISCFFTLFAIQVGINLIGALGPELGFDALWYHLTLPKIYLAQHRIVHVLGGLLYYSDMPKLTEMLYTAALIFGNENSVKVIHFIFGILSAITIYKLSLRFVSKQSSLIVSVIFYTNLVVGFLSTTSYIDLARTFFETLALFAFVLFVESKERKWLLESAVMMGLAIATKLLALSSLLIFSNLLLFVYIQNKKLNVKDIATNILVYWWLSLLIPLPWFIFSYLHTGNPIYPFFTSLYQISFNQGLVSPINIIGEIWILFTRLADPISPTYVIILPFIIYAFKKFEYKEKIIVLYCVLAIFAWYITPRTGGGRFILPYLPAFSLLTMITVEKYKNLKNLFLVITGVICLLNIIYRGVANEKYIPVLLGKQTKSDFLAHNLHFGFGDFYDVDGYFKKNITQDDRVLLYGFHNLYYVNFPFIDSSWVQKGNAFNYIAVQNSELPQRFKYWNLVYENKTTRVKLYTAGKQKWIY